MLITKLNHIINGIKWSVLLVFLVAYKINSEISLKGPVVSSDQINL
jgi:hypothetical protein